VLNDRPIIDAWSPLSHKRYVDDGRSTVPPTLAPIWVPANHRRRLDAYTILAAYRHNIARLFLPAVLAGDQTTGLIDNLQSDHREYGDADLIVDRVMAGVLGDNVEIVVDGADDDLPDAPQIPDEPVEPDNPSPLDQRIYTIRHTMWQDTANQIVDEWVQAVTDQPALRDRQQWLRQWADLEQLDAKLVEAEGDTISLGDGVYVLSWSTSKRRAVLDIYDPGFYFPVLTDDTRDYPTKVHLAWEYVDHDGQRWVRRLTWELAPIGMTPDGTPGNTIPVVDVPDESTWPDGTSTRRDPQGRLVRAYPWNVDDGGTIIDSTVTCYFTDATWPYGELDGRHVNDFDEHHPDIRFAETEDGTVAQRLDLRIDFLPVVHVPNTPAHREHFGRSALSMIAQILDDIASTDTDIQAASALAAAPVIGLSGSATLPNNGSTLVAGDGTSITAPPTLEVRPGVAFQLGENGQMNVVDLSAGLTALLELGKEQLGRLSVNSRVPPEILGRVPAASAASGVALALAFGPFNQLVGMLRLTRVQKYALLLKMVQRLAIAGGTLEAPVVPARLAFGSYLPSDRSQLVSEVTQLLAAHAISHQTGVALLVAGGLSIDDANHEVDRIRSDDPVAAKNLADATGSEQLAADWLGVTLPQQPTAPPVTLPPTPPGE